MVWIVVGIVVAVVLFAAWLVDRKWDIDPSSVGVTQARAQADSDAAWTATRDHSGGSV